MAPSVATVSVGTKQSAERKILNDVSTYGVAGDALLAIADGLCELGQG